MVHYVTHTHSIVNGNVRAYVDERLKDRSTAVDLDRSFTPASTSLDMLRDVPVIGDSREEAEISYVRT